MVAGRQERNIITYSSLLAAADRAGQWEEGLNIWGHLLADRCHPNLPAYNSAISCCAQGEHLSMAARMLQTSAASWILFSVFGASELAVQLVNHMVKVAPNQEDMGSQTLDKKAQATPALQLFILIRSLTAWL